jgi:hypothetical protein
MAQKKIFEATSVTINAEPFYKRTLAERAILNIKTKMAIRLHDLGTLHISICFFTLL